ncbi:MAG: amidohydrolase [Dehalococcoidia bacterium]|nr:MAG: amidohydrolase [Dehalococcoidia bacterium]
MTEQEQIINPEQPICDAHHHLWDRPGDRYLVEEFLRETIGGHNIVKSVFVGCKTMYRQDGPPEMSPVGETEFIERITAPTRTGKTKVAAGIVGTADLTLGAAVAPVLEAHIAAGKGRFRGIRVIGNWKVNPKWREGFNYLEKYGLSFDAFNTGTLSEVAELARTFPDTTIILNHIGGVLPIGPFAPDHERMVAEWRRGIEELSSCPNAVIKFGGLGMRTFGFGWAERETKPDSIEMAKIVKPYFMDCVENFGADRCLFESNFPPDRVSYSYTVLWNAFKRITKDFSPDEQAALFCSNAARVYRLGD